MLTWRRFQLFVPQFSMLFPFFTLHSSRSILHAPLRVAAKHSCAVAPVVFFIFHFPFSIFPD